MRRAFATLAVLLLFVGQPALPHELRPAVATLDRAGVGDTLDIELQINVEAMLAGVGIEHDDTDKSPQARTYDELRELSPAALAAKIDAFLPELLAGLDVSTDTGGSLTLTLSDRRLPPVGDIRIARDSILLLTAPLPADARTISWRWNPLFGPVIVRSADAEGAASFSVYLLPGDGSDAFPLPERKGPANAATSTDSAADLAAVPTADSSNTTPVESASESSRRSILPIVKNYLRVGFLHILPLGLDHILFVIGLFLLSAHLRPMFWQVTVFTLAHTVTLALGALDVVSISGRIVEPLIALSITAVCVENLFTSQLHRARLLIVFGFGLLHGLGFASVLQSAGGETGHFVVSLIAFNVGVELGQIAVLLLCFALLGWWARHKPWYRTRITIPLSLVIAVIGLYWFVQRVVS